MEINSVSSASNSLLKRVRQLQSRSGREKDGAFLLEGEKLFDEAVKHGIDIEAVVVRESFLQSDFLQSRQLSKVTVVDDKLFLDLATTEAPQGLVAIARIKRRPFDSIFQGATPLVVIADRVQDPGNLGTMMRTGLALGATGLILTKGSVDAFNPKVVRSAAGALFSLPFIESVVIEDAISECRKRELTVLAFSAGGKQQLKDIDFSKPSALLLGNEANGLDKTVEARADVIVSIPMSDASESLNVAIANAIILYEASRQRWR